MEAKKVQAGAAAAPPGKWTTSKHPTGPNESTLSLKTPASGRNSSAVASKSATKPVGLSAAAKAANIQYPIFQPKFSPPHDKPHREPPPPPPPPPNKYKITLGTKAAIVSTKKIPAAGMINSALGSPLPIKGHLHTPKHDVIRVQTRGSGFFDIEDNDEYFDENDSRGDPDRFSQMSPGRRQQVFAVLVDVERVTYTLCYE